MLQRTSGYSYMYNDANEHTRCRLSDGSLWIYGYDSLGQVVSGKGHWYDWTPTAGCQFEYSLDDIGNRTGAKAGGDDHGSNLRFASYAANSLNQYTARDVPGAIDIIGLELATNAVTVNGQTPYRHREYFVSG